MKRLRTLLVLGRVSNLPTVWTNCLVGMVAAAGTLEAIGGGNGFWALVIPERPGGEAFGVVPTGWWGVILGVSGLYVGGMFLNDWADAEWDRMHAPERPIPSRAISRLGVFVWAVCLFVFGWFTLTAMGNATSLWIWVLVGAIVVYDLVHKRWVGSVGIMGLCRFAVYPAAGSVEAGGAIGKVFPPALWGVAGGMFFYVVGVTLVARGERSGGVVKGVAWFCLSVPVLVWVWLGVSVTGVLMLLILAWWWWRTGGHLRVKGDRGRVGGFVSGLLAGIVIVDALMVSAVDGRAAWICLAMLPLCLLLQRKVPAT
ncbi:MAG: UbiA family prenyltransferase [Verrucomicrobiota bacterium]